MMILRPSSERGAANFGWLDTRHTFSFGHYHDPKHMGFGPLRVINEDKVEPGAGFETHGHQDMEIISYVLDGALEHKDSIGTGSVIRPGDVQRMTAGSGIRHSEFNHSDQEMVHFLQIWVLPNKGGLTPGYEQKNIPDTLKRGQLTLIASLDGTEHAVSLNQDVNLYVGLFDGEEQAQLAITEGRLVWVHVARGSIDLNGHRLSAGDGASLADESQVSLSNGQEAEVLVFDMIP